MTKEEKDDDEKEKEKQDDNHERVGDGSRALRSQKVVPMINESELVS